MELLPDEQRELFEEEQAYLPGVSEETPRPVYIQKGVVELSEAARRPVCLEEWETQEVERTVGEWRVIASRYGIDLHKRVKRPDGMRVEMTGPVYRAGRRVPGLVGFSRAPFHYQLVANRPEVILHVDEMLTRLAQARVPRTAKVKVVIDYVPE